MAEFCSKCCSKYGMKDDLDLAQIAYKLKRGYSKTFICEGCTVRGIYKDETGKTYVYYQNGNELEAVQETFEWKVDDNASLIKKLKNTFRLLNN